MYLLTDDIHLSPGAKKCNSKFELRKITGIIKRIAKYRLDKSEYDWLKSALLYRNG